MSSVQHNLLQNCNITNTKLRNKSYKQSQTAAPQYCSYSVLLCKNRGLFTVLFYLSSTELSKV